MKNLTITDLYRLCDLQIKKGNGNLKILLSNDDEGNGYHGLYYHFTELSQMGFNKNELLDLMPYDVVNNDKNDYIILG